MWIWPWMFEDPLTMNSKCIVLHSLMNGVMVESMSENLCLSGHVYYIVETGYTCTQADKSDDINRYPREKGSHCSYHYW
jgi:hypothetical protein